MKAEGANHQQEPDIIVDGFVPALGQALTEQGRQKTVERQRFRSEYEKHDSFKQGKFHSLSRDVPDHPNCYGNEQQIVGNIDKLEEGRILRVEVDRKDVDGHHQNPN